MKDIIKEMHEPCLFKCGFRPAKSTFNYNKEGLCYCVSPNKGNGYYWVYAKENLFSISIQDYVLYDDLFLEYKQPTYIGINYYDSISKKELQPYKQFNKSCIRGHISNNDLYRAIYHRNIPVHSVGIEIMPEFYENYLDIKYPGEFKNPQFAFNSINDIDDFSELIFVFRQIRNFRGTGAAAKMYYESKVFEAFSLIIEKNRNRNFTKKKILTSQDSHFLSLVHDYIEDNFIYDIKLDTLAEIALMGKTKLKYIFKETYKCTITQYIQYMRINYAEYLLVNSSLTIREISRAVGYNHVGYFSELFKRKTGLLPTQYRKLTKCNISL
ncbi:helix-turn-helix domain-containing protein [Clostridium senegalense]